MKPKQYFPIFILFSGIFIACTSGSNNPTSKNDVRRADPQQSLTVQSDTGRADELTILRNLLEPPSNIHKIDSSDNESGLYGQKVKLADALLCVNQFPHEMNRHAIMKTLQPINIHITQSRMTTESEEFGGYDLVAWLLGVVNKYDSAAKGKHMAIKLTFGIYSNDFLIKYIPKNAGLRAMKKDRITVFLIPYMKNNDSSIINDDDATAYELGGLQP